MHAQAKQHWHASDAIRCHACTAKNAREDAAAKDGNLRRGAWYVARPDDGMWHAMSDPVLTYPDDTTRWRVGASGHTYPPERPAPPDPD